MVTASEARCAQFVALPRCLRVLWARGLGPNSFPPCKPLIQKYKSSMQGRQLRIELHSTHGQAFACRLQGVHMKEKFLSLWTEDKAQDIAEYAVMLAVILVIVVGTIRLIGGNANNVFSSVASSIAQ